MTSLAPYRKFIAALAGAAAAILSHNLAHGTAQTWLITIVSVATALGVYATPNMATPAEPSAGAPPPA